MERTQGIIIRTTDYREKDRLLVVFTPKGIKIATAKGVRSEKAKLRSATQLMTLGEFDFGGKTEAKIISGAEYIDNFFDAWGDMDKISSTMFCFELTEKCYQNEEETANEFIFLLKIIKEIAYGQSAPICYALKYAIFTATTIGVDYTEIIEYNSEIYDVLSAFAVADIEEIGTLPYSKTKIEQALILLHNAFKNQFNIKINTLKALLN